MIRKKVNMKKKEKYTVTVELLQNTVTEIRLHYERYNELWTQAGFGGFSPYTFEDYIARVLTEGWKHHMLSNAKAMERGLEHYIANQKGSGKIG